MSRLSPTAVNLTMPAAVTLLVVGTLVAADRRVPPVAVATIAAGLGLTHGWLNGMSMIGGRQDGLSIVGVVSAAFVILAVVAAFVVSLQSSRVRLAVRVVGSWVAAIGLLMLGWGLREILTG